MIIKYFLSFLKHSAFKKNKISVIINCINLIFLIILKKNRIINLEINNNIVKFNFMPLAKAAGSRGIFVYRENYEPLLKFCDQLIKKNDIVLDIGANQGIYSIFFSKIVGPNGKVIAVEPFQEMIKHLEKNINLNNFENIKIFKKVVSNKIGFETLDFGKGYVSASIVRNFSSDKKLKVESTTIDEICKNFEKLNFIKIDIEGAELKALIGASNALEKFNPTLSLEVNSKSFNEINNLLNPLGYKPFVFDNNGHLKSVNEVKREYPTMIFKKI